MSAARAWLRYLQLEHEPIVACAVGGAVAGLVDVVAANVATPLGSFGTRVQHGLWDVALLVALGLFADIVLHALRAAFLRRSPPPRLARLGFWLVVFALGSAGMAWTLDRILSRQADSLLSGRAPRLLYLAFVLGAGLAVTLCVALGDWLGKKRRWFLLGVGMGVATAIGNEILYRDDYIEMHTAVVWCASTVIGLSLRRKMGERYATTPRRVQLGLAIALAATFLVGMVPPPNAVRLALFRSPGGVGSWVFATLYWKLPGFEHEPDPSIDPRWYEPRRDAEPRPPSADPLIAGAPVVVLVTIDAVRADDVLDPSHEKDLPNLTKLMREGATFTMARSAGSQTAVSLTALFSGKYFSEMIWKKFGQGSSRFEYAATDPTPRWVSMLADSGVSTTKVVSLTFLKNEFGVAPGFEEERVVTSGRRHARASEVIEPLLTRLAATHRDEALFAFVHLTEPHAPYDRGKVKNGTLHERYVSEIAVADNYVGKLKRALSTGSLAGRSMLIVSSDHGEAFGEHGTHEHTKTIYEELLRVPLVVWGHSVEARKIDTPVTLVDLGPTILDTFGLETPDWMAGESLVPLLRGEDATLRRPIFAEGRLRRALFLGDLKVIVDVRRKTVEAYDLSKDPLELDNIYDREPARVAPALAALARYFHGRQYTEGGYEPVYKP